MPKNALGSFSKEIQSEFAESDYVFATDEIVLKNGNAAEEIINQAKLYNCDLIVMACKSRSMLVETMVGGTTPAGSCATVLLGRPHHGSSLMWCLILIYLNYTFKERLK